MPQLHAAFEWLRQQATKEGAPAEAGHAFDAWFLSATTLGGKDAQRYQKLRAMVGGMAREAGAVMKDATR